MHRTLTLLSLCLVVGIAACDEATAPTSTARPELPDPSFNFGNGPSDPGPVVLRGEGINPIFYVDPAAGLSAVHGADVVDFCLGGAAFDVVDIQTLFSPSGPDRVLSLIHGEDLTTSVWPFTAFDCALFTTVAPLATGTADVVATDNDVFLAGPNVNSFGFRAHGVLETPAGAAAPFSGHQHCLIDVDGFGVRCRSQIRLRMK